MSDSSNKTISQLFFVLFVVLLVELFPSVTFAKIELKVSMTHKLGIDNNLVLKSELHSIEEFFGSEQLTVTMRNGFKLNLQAMYLNESEEVQFGPLDLVQINAELFSPNGESIKKFIGVESQIRLWKSRKFLYNGKSGQQIEIIIAPEPS